MTLPVCYLQAYTIPRSHFTISAMFTGKYQTPDPTDPDGVRMLDQNFYGDYGEAILQCMSWGLLVHAVLHVVKDLLMVQLLWAPSAVRVCERSDSAGAKKGKSLAAHFTKLVTNNQLKEGEDVMDVAPGVHNSRLLQVHNLATLLFWLACCFLLLDGQIESWPLHKYLRQRQFYERTGLPIWGLYSVVYVGEYWLLGSLLQITSAYICVFAEALLIACRSAADTCPLAVQVVQHLCVCEGIHAL